MMGWPQITWLILAGISFGLVWSKHGEPKEGNHNAFVSLIALLISYGLLRAGGFFP